MPEETKPPLLTGSGSPCCGISTAASACCSSCCTCSGGSAVNIVCRRLWFSRLRLLTSSSRFRRALVSWFTSFVVSRQCSRISSFSSFSGGDGDIMWMLERSCWPACWGADRSCAAACWAHSTLPALIAREPRPGMPASWHGAPSCGCAATPVVLLVRGIAAAAAIAAAAPAGPTAAAGPVTGSGGFVVDSPPAAGGGTARLPGICS
mmetsp:Transcript_115563/g.368789  ORF Transcript_115563/g.368789 Transcript_115563/m.368789 type:complete len:207 (-) Transcript_115563:238-858(-)